MSNQVKRIFSIYKKLQNGLKVRSTEIFEDIKDDYEGTTLRTVQRDLKLLTELDPMIETEKEGLELVYKMSKGGTKIPTVDVYSQQVLSFYFLKAHLNAFKNTKIEEDVNLLMEKLETYARGDVFDEMSIYWDKNPGYFDYTQFDPQIRRVINAIVNEKWVNVIYETGQDDEKSIACKLIKMFSYNGSLYTVAYVKHHNAFIALAIQKILSVNEIFRPTNELVYHKVPVFDMDEFSKYRFGVFWGEPEDVELTIDKDFIKYFSNRHWHQTQNFSYDKNENMILKMKVPVTPELKAWIISWSNAITVEKPEKLKHSLIEDAERFAEKHRR